MSRHLALGAYVAVCVLFAWKYAARVTVWAPAVAIALGGTQLLVARYADRWLSRRRTLYALGGLVAAAFVATAIVAALTIEPAGLNVDRWSVITSFLEALLAGDYPYGARSHLGNPPGPMPVYFLLAYPFYLLGEFTWLSLLGYLAAVWWIIRRADRPAAALLLLASAPFAYWEIAVRSNIFTFSVLVLWGLEMLDRSHSPPKSLAVGLGGLLATRSVFVLAYIIYFLHALRRGVIGRGALIRTAVLAALTFFAVFLPLWWWWPAEFWNLNPFVVQSTFLLPPVFVPGFLLLAGVLGTTGRIPVDPATADAGIRLPDSSLRSGWALFAAIAIYAAYHLTTRGWSVALHGSLVDLSYFLFALPFLGYAWARASTAVSA